MATNNVYIKNKKAYFSYEIIEKFEAGIELFGSEIKSIREGKASLTDAYCKFFNNQLWVLMSIQEYSHASVFNHEPNRERRLLLTRRELNKLERKIQNSGLTIIPLALYINKRGFAKLEIAMAKGKKSYDHRHTIKDKDEKRIMERERKYRI
jgi:SsrA-binding protein